MIDGDRTVGGGPARPGAIADGGDPATPNLLLIVVDCLRQDVLRADHTETPFLDDLRGRGVECTECYATATTTTPAVASLLTGTYSERNGLQSLRRGHLADDVETLGSLLGDRGYHREAQMTGPLVTETGLDRGFDRYRCREEDQSLFGDWRERALARLDELPEPFAAVVHLWELHEDVTVPPSFDEPRYGATPYGRALSALDRELRTLVEQAPPNTVVALVGDHGESVTRRHSRVRLLLKSLRDAVRYYGGVDTRPLVRRLNRRWANRGADVADHYIENGHGENVFDFTTNVPFVLAGAGVDAATVDAQVRQVDVLPTLLDALGVGPEATDAVFDGEPIRPANGVDDRPAYMRACGASLHRERNWARAVRDGEADAKLVTFPDRDWDDALYDLAADPAELSTVEDERLAARLRRRLPDADLDTTDADRLDIDDRLEDLGYR
ncbi:MAG: sulfatase-like hydrolase/transferase [Halobacteriaceae archaeon]